jgi:hypothetical protein
MLENTKKFYIFEQLNRDTEKKYLAQKPLTYTFHYWGAFAQFPIT